MKTATKIVAVLLVLIMAFGMLTACESEKAAPASGGAAGTGDSGNAPAPITGGKDLYKDQIKISVISISTLGVSNRLYQMALKDQASRYPNISVDFKDAEYDPNRQITLIEEAITQGYDAILIECMDPVAANEAILSAEKAGIVVVSNGAAQPTCIHTLHNRMEDYNNGWKSGEVLAGMVGGEGTAIILDVPAIQKASARMGNGFQDYIEKNTNIKLLEPPIGIDNWSADNAQISMRDMLTKYGPGEITMVYCCSDDIAVGAMNAIDQAGRTGDMLVWGMFGYPAGLEGVKSGKLAGTMFSDVYVQYSMLFYILLDHIATGVNSYTAGYTETTYVEMPMHPVTADNIDNIMAVSRWFS